MNRKMKWYILTMKYYSAFKRNEILKHRESQKATYYIIPTIQHTDWRKG